MTQLKRLITIGPATALCLNLALRLATAACGHAGAAPTEGGEDAEAGSFTICDAFSGTGTDCPFASPLRCFPECEVGGCYCRATAGGPRWACITDPSCTPDCSPIDDTCPSPPAYGGDASADSD